MHMAVNNLKIEYGNTVKQVNFTETVFANSCQFAHIYILGKMENFQLAHEKKETMFYGQMGLPIRVDWSGHVFLNISFFFLVAKITPLKSTKI